MPIAVSSINYIRHCGFTQHQFQHFLSELDAEYGDVFYHTEVWWLSRGKVLRTFFSLHHEVDVFPKEKRKGQEVLFNPGWICDLAFLTDITEHLKHWI